MSRAIAKNTGSALLNTQMRPLVKYFKTPGLVEICINRPGEIWLETYEGWQRVEDPALSFEQLWHFAAALATAREQGFSTSTPILATALPEYGYRVFVVAGQMVVGGFGMTIRVAQAKRFEVEGYFDHAGESSGAVAEPSPASLSSVYIEGAAGIKQAVKDGKTILVAGGTSSGKTTLFNSLIQYTPPETRVISIEDTQELRIDCANKLQLIKSKTGTDVAQITYRDLINACMRMRPDRLYFGELDIENTAPFGRLINTGHGGSMATVHASSSAGVMKALVQNALLDPAKAIGGAPEYIEKYFRQAVDIIVFIERLGRAKFRARAEFLHA
jgi:type IV secretion system protein VirB11